MSCRLIPVGKETDRRWEQGEDPSLVDFKVTEYRKAGKLAIAVSADRKKWKKAGVREGMRKSALSQKAVSAILTGKPVRLQTLAIFKRAADNCRVLKPTCPVIQLLLWLCIRVVLHAALAQA